MTTDPSGFPTDSPSEVHKPRRMTWRKWLAVGVAAVVVLGGVGAGAYFLLRPTNTSATRTFTRDVEVTKGDQTQTVSLDGTLSPRKQSEVNFSVSGTVTSVKVKAGDKVTKGQKLATIDDSSLQNAVDLATANLASAKANRTEVYDNDGSSAAKKSANAQVTSAAAALSSAQDDLDDAVLRSPITGTVASVDLEVGDTVGSSSGNSSNSASTNSSTSSSASFVIIETAKWKVEGSIGAADLASVKAGQKVSVTTDASTDALSGTVASVGIVATSTSDDGTATFPIVVNISGSHTDLYSGTTATAVITTGSYTDVLTVPTAAIKSENNKTVVTKVSGSQTSTVEVEVGKVFGTYTQITSGLSEGDTVRISFTRTASTTGSSSGGQGGFGFGGGGGFGGGLDGGGAPPAGAPPAGAGGGTGGR
jgi:RND family efflux transporter MFP subunit